MRKRKKYFFIIVDVGRAQNYNLQITAIKILNKTFTGIKAIGQT